MGFLGYATQIYQQLPAPSLFGVLRLGLVHLSDHNPSR